MTSHGLGSGSPAALCALAALLASSCARGGAPCAAPSCGPGFECLANTCAPLGAEPVPRDTTRIVLEPVAVAATAAPNGNSGVVDLGRRWAALYLRFDAGWRNEGAVVRAFLLLEPARGWNDDADDLALAVWTIGAPWSPSRIAIGARPSLGPPHARGLLRSSPTMTARIDVTPVVRALAEKPSDEGIAVVLGEEPNGEVHVLTGGADGAPRLELYVRAR